MFRGFEVSVGDDFLRAYTDAGLAQHRENKRRVYRRLDEFRGASGEILSGKMTAAWFPEVEAQVFISHAHKDSALALGLSGHLHKRFGLKSFVDSAVWGYSDDLLQILDKEFCYNDESGTYSYQKRNRSTSHVHMMLSVALSRMIDRCECIIFINTPQSISSRECVGGQATSSPWIYSELAMTSLIARRTLDAHRGTKVTAATESFQKDLNVSYEVDLDHLTKLNQTTYERWAASTQVTGTKALDVLYGLVPPPPHDVSVA